MPTSRNQQRHRLCRHSKRRGRTSVSNISLSWTWKAQLDTCGQAPKQVCWEHKAFRASRQVEMDLRIKGAWVRVNGVEMHWSRHGHQESRKRRRRCKLKTPRTSSISLSARADSVQSPLLYLCDNEPAAVLQDVTSWTRTRLAKNKDADCTDIIERLHLRVAAGTATFLLKIKLHRAEIMNEMADIAAEEGRMT